MSTNILLRDLTVSLRGRVVLDGVDLTAQPGERIGLVGENGSGKSTLLRVAAGLLTPDGGEVQVPPDLGYLPQDSGLDPGATVAGVLHHALAPLHEAVARLERLATALAHDTAATPAADAGPGDTGPGDTGAGDAGAGDGIPGQLAVEYDAALAWAQAHDAWDADRRSRVAARRLGLQDLRPEQPVNELSGGERSRLALAALLTRQPVCLLLDEPTNHLDDEALDFLESALLGLPGVVVAASHDRVFLERLCTSVIDLDPSHFGTDGRGGRRFTGGYSTYLHHKQAARRRWVEAYEAEQDERASLEASARTVARDIAHGRAQRDNDGFIHHFKGSRVQDTVRRRVRNAEQRLAALDRRAVPRPPAPLTLTGAFDQPVRAARVRAREVAVEGRLRLDRLDVDPGEKLLLTGPNGSGKSTLLGVLAGRVRADAGTVDVQARRVGHLPQDVRFRDPGRSARAVFEAAAPRRDLVELGLLPPGQHSRPVGELSLGQQRRLALALLVAGLPDLVLLDEPSNHLSLALVEELEQALRDTPATVVVASHDRWLRRRWSGSHTELGPA